MPTSKKRKKVVEKQKAARRPRPTDRAPLTFTIDATPEYDWPDAPWDVYLATKDAQEASVLATTRFPITQGDFTMLGSLADEAGDVGKTVAEAATSMAGFAAKGQLSWSEQTATYLVESDELEDWSPVKDEDIELEAYLSAIRKANK